jgi:hypothetical protein
MLISHAASSASMVPAVAKVPPARRRRVMPRLVLDFRSRYGEAVFPDASISPLAP